MPFVIASWNINAIRLGDALMARPISNEAPNILCLQERKTHAENMPLHAFVAPGATGARFAVRAGLTVL